MKREVSEEDVRYLAMIRENVSRLLREAGQQYDRQGLRVLDVAPQDHAGAAPDFPLAEVETLDIAEDSGATYIADLCQDNRQNIPAAGFDLIICTEVLEHVLQPFKAVAEIRRLLRPGGRVLVSTPFNFRIHGPLPDCWRFTEHGLRALFADFEQVDIGVLETQDRFLMPVHYTLEAVRPED